MFMKFGEEITPLAYPESAEFLISVDNAEQFPLLFQELGMHDFVFFWVLKQTTDRA